MTKGPGSRAAGLAMVFKLLVAFVRAGAKFEKGALLERLEQAAQEVAA